MSALVELDCEIAALVAGVPTPIPDAENLTLLANGVRRILNAYSQDGKIQGFVFDVNGVDATDARVDWPADVLESGQVRVNVHVAPVGAHVAHMKAEFVVGKFIAPHVVAPEISDAAEPEGDGHDDFFTADHSEAG